MKIKEAVFRNLRGRTVKQNSISETLLNLTAIEVALIQQAIDNYEKGNSFIVPITKRIHIDFIGWDNPKYMDLLICLNKK